MLVLRFTIYVMYTTVTIVDLIPIHCNAWFSKNKYEGLTQLFIKRHIILVTTFDEQN